MFRFLDDLYFVYKTLLVSEFTAKMVNINILMNKLVPRGRLDDVPPPMAVRLVADLRPQSARG